MEYTSDYIKKTDKGIIVKPFYGVVKPVYDPENVFNDEHITYFIDFENNTFKIGMEPIPFKTYIKLLWRIMKRVYNIIKDCEAVGNKEYIKKIEELRSNLFKEEPKSIIFETEISPNTSSSTEYHQATLFYNGDSIANSNSYSLIPSFMKIKNKTHISFENAKISDIPCLINFILENYPCFDYDVELIEKAFPRMPGNLREIFFEIDKNDKKWKK